MGQGAPCGSCPNCLGTCVPFVNVCVGLCVPFEMMDYLQNFDGLNGHCSASVGQGGTCEIDANNCNEGTIPDAQLPSCQCECVSPGTCKARKFRKSCKIVDNSCNKAKGFFHLQNSQIATVNVNRRSESSQ